MSNGYAHTRTTLWLGSDDGDPDGWNGGGFAVRTEDSMVSIEAGLEDERGADLQVFIMRDLFPAIRKAMDTIDARYGCPDRESTPAADELGRDALC